MQDAFSRMELLVGNTGVKKLSRAKIAVFGLGGAGSQVAESLARCGVGSLTLIDHEKITLTNIGSQVLALHSTLGMSKVERRPRRESGILMRIFWCIPTKPFIMRRLRECLNCVPLIILWIQWEHCRQNCF